MKITGKVWRFGDNIDTDVIIPARYLNTSEPAELAKHCMEDADTSFAGKVAKGDIIVGGANFGCGSSREHAPIAIKASGVSCVVAEFFARIFYRNAFNMGLPIIECPEAVREASTGHILVVDPAKGEIVNQSLGKTYQAAPIPPFMMELVEAGGLMEYTVMQLEKESA